MVKKKPSKSELEAQRREEQAEIRDAVRTAAKLVESIFGLRQGQEGHVAAVMRTVEAVLALDEAAEDHLRDAQQIARQVDATAPVDEVLRLAELLIDEGFEQNFPLARKDAQEIFGSARLETILDVYETIYPEQPEFEDED